jgi:phage FluMu gp28-like protein
MWCRGGGKSKLTALKIVLDAFQADIDKKPSDWLIVSATSGQAKEALTHVAGWAQLFYAIAAKIEIIETEIEFRTEDGKERYTLYEIRLGKNIRIKALSASPSAIRGYTANIWWDEACFFQNDHDMWAALQHCTRGYLKMFVTSTPIGGPERKFHQIVHDKTEIDGMLLWSHHVCDIYRAVAEGRPYDIATQKALAKDPYRFAQEMLLHWLDGEQTWFKQELIAACEDSRASSIGHGYTPHSRCFIGNDVGLRGDRWVAWTLETTEDFGLHIIDRPDGQKESYYTGELITREVVVLGRSTFAEHDREMARLFKKYSPIRMCIDSGGMGEKPTEDYQRLYGLRVEGVLFNVDNKGAMAMLGLEMMTDRRVLLPSDHPEIGMDFRKLQRSVSAAGNVRFVAERDSSGHADMCWAFLLALNAACMPTTQIKIVSSGESVQEQNIMAGWTTGLEGMRSGR